MKKLLLIALLLMAVVLTAVSCTEEKPPEETTGETKGDTIPATGDETEPETPAEDTQAPDTDPVDETDPPVEDTKAPETDPPVEDTKAPETDPPAEDTKAPETDPPAGPTILTPAEAGVHNRVCIDVESADNYQANVAGWVGFDGKTIVKAGYAIDGGDIVWVEGAITELPDEDPVKLDTNGGSTASRYSITAYYDDVESGEHDVCFYLQLSDDSIVEIHGKLVDVQPAAPVEKSEAAFNSADNADLSAILTFLPGASPEACIYNAPDGEGFYVMAGINQLTMATKGSYTMTITGVHSDNAHATFFVRGNPVPNFGDGNYYGHDGCGNESVGCAGIYFSVITAEDGSISLRINVKGGLADGKAVPHIYTVPLTGRDITVTDDNNTISVYDGETRVAAIQLTGFYRGYAEKALVILPGKAPELLDDLAIAADANSDIGFIARSSTLKFTGFSIAGIDPVEPAAKETLPEAPEAGCATQVKPSWDTIYKNDENNLAQADGAAADKFTTAPIVLDDTWHTLMVRGWGGSGNANNKIVAFAYRINMGPFVLDPNAYREAEQGVINAGGDARYCISIPTADLIGGMYYIQAYGICADGTPIELLNMWIQGAPDLNTTIDAEFNAADETGTTVGGSNLSGIFAFTQAAAGPSVIEDGVYILKDFTEAIANPDGYYAFTANIDSVGNHKLSAMFVRGVYNFNFGDGGYFGAIFSNGINGGPNSNYSGSAGIYLVAANEGLGVTNLTVRFHCWDGSAVTIKEYMIPVNSTKITVVDKGDVVYILAGDELAATVTISGTKDFGYTGQNGAVVDPDACAETVAIKTATIDEIVPNAVVAATYKSHIGLATRAGGGSISVSYVSLKAASTVTIPDSFVDVAPPVEYVNLALGKDTSLTTSVENDANIPANATDGDSATRWGAFPTGEASFIVNFGEITKVRFLQIDFENTVLPWTVYVSTDGQNWTEMYKGKSGGGRTEVIDFGGLVELQYVKITRDTEPEGQGSNWFSIYEFIAYGETVADEEPEKDLTINKTEYAFGEEILVTAKGETAGQWVGLYRIDDNYEGGAVASLYWYYINADGHTSGETYVINQLTNNANSDRYDLTHLPAGQYKIILFADGGYTAHEQVEFTILPVESTLTADKTTYALGETININALTMGSTDWVAVYPAGAAAEQYIGYYYPIGPTVTDALWNKRNGVTVDLNAMLAAMNTPVGPLGVGSYDIYLLADNSYDQVLAKITITITEA